MSGQVDTQNSRVIINPVGLPGKNGSSFTASSGAPSPSSGIYGDVHADLSNGDMYRKELGGWVLLDYKFEGASAYTIAVSNGFVGTEEQWLASLIGQRGDKAEFRVFDGFIQWKFTEDSQWINLIELSELKGDKGDKGDKGNTVEIRSTDTHIQWRELKDDAPWVNIVALDDLIGPQGQAIELQTSATHIQWRVTGSADWLDLVLLEDLRGDTGASIELQKTATHVQWRVEGTTEWFDLVPLTEITGPRGFSVELQSSPTHIQWRVEGTDTWIDLVELSSLKGDKGDAVEMQTNATHIQWRVTGTDAWVDLIPLSELIGPRGHSVELQTTTTHIQWRVEGETVWEDLVSLEDLKGDTGASVEMQTSATHIQWRVEGTDTWINLTPLEDLKGPMGDVTPALQQLKDDAEAAAGQAEAAKDDTAGLTQRAEDAAQRAEAAAGANSNAVTYEDQTGSKTPEEQEIARKNIGANDASNLNEGELPSSVFTDTSHGVRGGGDLHEAATEAAAGFMTSDHVTKLNELYSKDYEITINGETGNVFTLDAAEVGAVPLGGSNNGSYEVKGFADNTAWFRVQGLRANGFMTQVMSDYTYLRLKSEGADGYGSEVEFRANSSMQSDLRGFKVSVKEYLDGLPQPTEATFTLKADGNMEVTGTPSNSNDVVPKRVLEEATEALQKTNQKNQPSGYAGLDTEGKLPISLIPALALAEVSVVSSEEEMLALDFQEGDIAIRTDVGLTYILLNEPATELSNWVELLAPTGGISSVGINPPEGMTASADITTSGKITLTYDDGYAPFTTALNTRISKAIVASNNSVDQGNRVQIDIQQNRTTAKFMGGDDGNGLELIGDSYQPYVTYTISPTLSTDLRMTEVFGDINFRIRVKNSDTNPYHRDFLFNFDGTITAPGTPTKGTHLVPKSFLDTQLDTKMGSSGFVKVGGFTSSLYTHTIVDGNIDVRPNKDTGKSNFQYVLLQSGMLNVTANRITGEAYNVTLLLENGPNPFALIFTDFTKVEGKYEGTPGLMYRVYIEVIGSRAYATYEKV